MTKLAASLLSIFLYMTPFASAEIPLSQYQGKFSTLNEENIIQSLLNTIPDVKKFYVDIGAGDGVSGSNTARLAYDGWHGLALEGSHDHVSKCSLIYRDIPQVKIFESFVTPLNVCDLLEAFNTPKDLGVLSLDIDSYDYFVLEALLKKFRPTIIVTEINEKIPPPLEFTVLYDKDHAWEYNHFFVQSISQLEKLCLEQNYALVTLEYNNAVLVAKEKYKGKDLSAKEAYLIGYQLKADRTEKFPWNADMEIMLTSTPEDNVDFLLHFFSKYKGKFNLSDGKYY
jgi:hypothetical protein